MKDITNLYFFETILDNMLDGVYVLDSEGNYLYANSTYIKHLNISKDELLTKNVHWFLETGQIAFCVSDIVYQEKRQVVLFQDVFDALGYGRKTFRQLIISTPLFDGFGNISHVIAMTRSLDVQKNLFAQARTEVVSHFERSPKFMFKSGASIVAESPAMKAMLEMVEVVAKVDSSVLITGESGTGKEVVSNYIHDKSPRSDKPLVVINCASVPEALLEAELFGYEKGSFTGASSAKKGLFEEAHGGTLFLDEINSLPLALQGKVLRALETKKIQHIGSSKLIDVDFRLVAAANENLKKMVDDKLFRSDLYYRINVIPFEIPPLRDRKEDIAPLARLFLDSFCTKYGKQKTFSAQTATVLEQYDWPGNVRELRNTIERAVVMSYGDVIHIENIGSFMVQEQQKGQECTEIREQQKNQVSLSEKTSQTGQVCGSTKEQQKGQDRQMEQVGFLLESEKDKKDRHPGPVDGVATDDKNALFEKMVEEGISLKAYLEQCEQEYVAWAMEKYGSTYEAARMLGTSQSSIMRKKNRKQ